MTRWQILAAVSAFGYLVTVIVAIRHARVDATRSPLDQGGRAG